MPGILDFRKGTENAGLELRPETWQDQLLPTRGPMDFKPFGARLDL